MEITQDLNVTIEEETLLDMHSVLNVLTIISLELLNLAEEVGDLPELRDLHDRTVEAADHLRNPECAEQTVQHVDEFIRNLTTTMDGVIQQAEPRTQTAVREILANLESIFTILRVRAREIVARHRDPDAWVEHEVAQLRDNFTSVLQAIERNSHGRYRIVYNVAEHEVHDYLVHFGITSADETTITMPAVFQDVMRDLLANARKYTPPGGEISAGLYNSGAQLRYIVEDTGIGIPADEIQAILDFGSRASNVSDHATRGGGFGLTKAYYITKKFGGRMWIDSQTDPPTGTRVEIRIPVP